MSQARAVWCLEYGGAVCGLVGVAYEGAGAAGGYDRGWVWYWSAGELRGKGLLKLAVRAVCDWALGLPEAGNRAARQQGGRGGSVVRRRRSTGRRHVPAPAPPGTGLPRQQSRLRSGGCARRFRGGGCGAGEVPHRRRGHRRCGGRQASKRRLKRAGPARTRQAHQVRPLVQQEREQVGGGGGVVVGVVHFARLGVAPADGDALDADLAGAV